MNVILNLSIVTCENMFFFFFAKGQVVLHRCLYSKRFYENVNIEKSRQATDFKICYLAEYAMIFSSG